MHADWVLINGRVYTMDAAQPLAQAVAVQGGQIVAVGNNHEIQDLIGPETDRYDAEGRAVTPGFTDAHLHLVGYGLGLERLMLQQATSVQDVAALVGERIREAAPGDWVLGWGWDRNLWALDRFPNKAVLDVVAPYNPVLLMSKDGHTAWVNSFALDLAGLTKDSTDPPGGHFERDVHDELTGILQEGPAIERVEARVPPPDAADRAAGVQAATARLQRGGIVGVHTMGGWEDMSTLQQVWQAGQLDLRVRVMLPAEHLDHAVAIGLQGGFGDDWLRLLGIKIFADGALGSRSADMLEGYATEPENRGIEVTSTAELRQLVSKATAGGWPVAVHAIGDHANRRVLDVLAEFQADWQAQGLRPRIEHVQLLAPSDGQRLADMGAVASMQPIHATSDMLMADAQWGERARYAYAWRTLLDAGATLAFGSDAPVEEPNVLQGIHAAVTRQRRDGTPDGGWYPQECITVAEAVYAYTLGAAYAANEEWLLGSIAVGKLGDIAVLADDIFEIRPEEILRTHVVATIIEGDVVYQAAH